MTLGRSPATKFSMTLDEQLAMRVRAVPDFPKPGILFRDITPVLAEPLLLRHTITLFANKCREANVTKLVGIDARGFLFGAAAAIELELGFVPVRKAGKLPAATVSASYDLEYGSATVEMHSDSIVAGERVAVIDDLLATGGTAEAACKLVEQLGGEVAIAIFMIELTDLGGRQRLAPRPVESLLSY